MTYNLIFEGTNDFFYKGTKIVWKIEDITKQLAFFLEMQYCSGFFFLFIYLTGAFQLLHPSNVPNARQRIGIRPFVLQHSLHDRFKKNTLTHRREVMTHPFLPKEATLFLHISRRQRSCSSSFSVYFSCPWINSSVLSFPQYACCMFVTLEMQSFHRFVTVAVNIDLLIYRRYGCLA